MEVQQFLHAAERSPRAELGFSSLPADGPVGVERPRWKRDYDVMLHLGRRNVSRTVTFLIRGGRPVWIGEQEIHYGPRTFDSVDGTFNEDIVLSCSLEDLSGAPKGCYVRYTGPTSDTDRKVTFSEVSVEEAKRIWGPWDRTAEAADRPPNPALQPPAAEPAAAER